MENIKYSKTIEVTLGAELVNLDYEEQESKKKELLKEKTSIMPFDLKIQVTASQNIDKILEIIGDIDEKIVQKTFPINNGAMSRTFQSDVEFKEADDIRLKDINELVASVNKAMPHFLDKERFTFDLLKDNNKEVKGYAETKKSELKIEELQKSITNNYAIDESIKEINDKVKELKTKNSSIFKDEVNKKVKAIKDKLLSSSDKEKNSFIKKFEVENLFSEEYSDAKDIHFKQLDEKITEALELVKEAIDEEQKLLLEEENYFFDYGLSAKYQEKIEKEIKESLEHEIYKESINSQTDIWEEAKVVNVKFAEVFKLVNSNNFAISDVEEVQSSIEKLKNFNEKFSSNNQLDYFYKPLQSAFNYASDFLQRNIMGVDVNNVAPISSLNEPIKDNIKQYFLRHEFKSKEELFNVIISLEESINGKIEEIKKIVDIGEDEYEVIYKKFCKKDNESKTQADILISNVENIEFDKVFKNINKDGKYQEYEQQAKEVFKKFDKEIKLKVEKAKNNTEIATRYIGKAYQNIYNKDGVLVESEIRNIAAWIKPDSKPKFFAPFKEMVEMLEKELQQSNEKLSPKELTFLNKIKDIEIFSSQNQMNAIKQIVNAVTKNNKYVVIGMEPGAGKTLLNRGIINLEAVFSSNITKEDKEQIQKFLELEKSNISDTLRQSALFKNLQSLKFEKEGINNFKINLPLLGSENINIVLDHNDFNPKEQSAEDLEKHITDKIVNAFIISEAKQEPLIEDTKKQKPQTKNVGEQGMEKKVEETKNPSGTLGKVVNWFRGGAKVHQEKKEEVPIGQVNPQANNGKVDDFQKKDIIFSIDEFDKILKQSFKDTNGDEISGYDILKKCIAKDTASLEGGEEYNLKDRKNKVRVINISATSRTTFEVNAKTTKLSTKFGSKLQVDVQSDIDNLKNLVKKYDKKDVKKEDNDNAILSFFFPSQSKVTEEGFESVVIDHELPSLYSSYFFLPGGNFSLFDIEIASNDRSSKEAGDNNAKEEDVPEGEDSHQIPKTQSLALSGASSGASSGDYFDLDYDFNRFSKWILNSLVATEEGNKKLIASLDKDKDNFIKELKKSEPERKKVKKFIEDQFKDKKEGSFLCFSAKENGVEKYHLFKKGEDGVSIVKNDSKMFFDANKLNQYANEHKIKNKITVVFSKTDARGGNFATPNLNSEMNILNFSFNTNNKNEVESNWTADEIVSEFYQNIKRERGEQDLSKFIVKNSNGSDITKDVFKFVKDYADFQESIILKKLNIAIDESSPNFKKIIKDQISYLKKNSTSKNNPKDNKKYDWNEIIKIASLIEDSYEDPKEVFKKLLGKTINIKSDEYKKVSFKIFERNCSAAILVKRIAKYNKINEVSSINEEIDNFRAEEDKYKNLKLDFLAKKEDEREGFKQKLSISPEGKLLIDYEAVSGKALNSQVKDVVDRLKENKKLLEPQAFVENYIGAVYGDSSNEKDLAIKTLQLYAKKFSPEFGDKLFYKTDDILYFDWSLYNQLLGINEKGEKCDRGKFNKKSFEEFIKDLEKSIKNAEGHKHYKYLQASCKKVNALIQSEKDFASRQEKPEHKFEHGRIRADLLEEVRKYIEISVLANQGLDKLIEKEAGELEELKKGNEEYGKLIAEIRKIKPKTGNSKASQLIEKEIAINNKSYSQIINGFLGNLNACKKNETAIKNLNDLVSKKGALNKIDDINKALDALKLTNQELALQIEGLKIKNEDLTVNATEIKKIADFASELTKQIAETIAVNEKNLEDYIVKIQDKENEIKKLIQDKENEIKKLIQDKESKITELKEGKKEETLQKNDFEDFKKSINLIDEKSKVLSVFDIDTTQINKDEKEGLTKLKGYCGIDSQEGYKQKINNEGITSIIFNIFKSHYRNILETQSLSNPAIGLLKEQKEELKIDEGIQVRKVANEELELGYSLQTFKKFQPSIIIKNDVTTSKNQSVKTVIDKKVERSFKAAKEVGYYNGSRFESFQYISNSRDDNSYGRVFLLAKEGQGKEEFLEQAKEILSITRDTGGKSQPHLVHRQENEQTKDVVSISNRYNKSGKLEFFSINGLDIEQNLNGNSLFIRIDEAKYIKINIEGSDKKIKVDDNSCYNLVGLSQDFHSKEEDFKKVKVNEADKEILENLVIRIQTPYQLDNDKKGYTRKITQEISGLNENLMQDDKRVREFKKGGNEPSRSVSIKLGKPLQLSSNRIKTQ